MTLAAIYFDLDGTLVDSEYLHAVSWNHVLSDFGIHYSEDEFCAEFAGKPTVVAAKHIVSIHNLDISPSTLANKKHERFAFVSQRELPVLLQGAKDLLSWCQEQGLKVALVTGSAKSEAQAILNGHQLNTFFDVIFTRDDVTNAKPHPEPYLSAIKALLCDAKRGLAIEDTVTGSNSAVSAGLFTVAVPNKYSAQSDFSHVQSVCSSLSEVKELIKSKI